MPQKVEAATAAQRRAVRITTCFVIFVCLALLAVDVWLARHARDLEVRRAMTANSNLAQGVSQQMDGMFSEVGNILSNIVYDLEQSDIDAGVIERLQPVLVNHTSLTQHLHDLFVYDANGAWLVTSLPLIPVSANNSDRDYFAHHRANRSVSARIGKPIVSRSTGIWVIPVSRRFNDADGNFAGVVLATIKVDYLLQVISNFEVGKEGAISLMLRDGAIVVRRPFAAADIGKSIAGSALYAQVIKNRAGNIEIASPIDGLERAVSYRHLQDHPVVVSVAVSKSEMLQDWRATTLLQTGWILLLCVVIGAAGIYVVRSVRERLTVELSLGRTRDELTVANQQLAYVSRHDSLTTLANRRYFDEVFQQEFAESRRSRRPLAVIMLDVDHFKRYNDIYGHPEGDRCLQQVALAVQSAARRPRDFVARYGGEEMVFVLPDTDAEGAVVVAEAARKAVVDLRLPHAGIPIGYVSVSAGVAAHTPDEDVCQGDDLLKAADSALYSAKRAGRNTVFSQEHSV